MKRTSAIAVVFIFSFSCISTYDMITASIDKQKMLEEQQHNAMLESVAVQLTEIQLQQSHLQTQQSRVIESVKKLKEGRDD